MKLALKSTATKADVLFLLLYKGEKLSPNAKKALGSSTTKLLNDRIKAKDFEGDEGQSLKLYLSGGKFKQVIALGRGEKDKQMPSATELLGGQIAAQSKVAKAKSITIITNSKDLSELAYGLVLGNYEFTYYKKQGKKTPKLLSATFITSESKAAKDVLKNAKIFMNTSELSRNLVNLSSGDLDTIAMTKEAQKVAKKYKMKITVLDEKKLKKLGCGAIIGVGQGAVHGPRMILLEYKNKAKSKNPDLALVGKGITFDTGGLNLKPTGYIETMKQDMAGAATVLATMKAIAQAKLKGYFLGVLCCAENAVSDRAAHPGDVLKAYNGKTIEVTNTDAEGRLVLADGLSYTEKNYKPKAMINIATLTGAVSVALGYQITGVMGNDQKFINEILDSAAATHERMWQLPLDADFVKATKGTITDLKNSTDGVRAGSTMGGAFLKNFVDKTTWAHLDIGGTAWADKATATNKYGSTGVALRTLFEVAKRHSR